MAAITVFLLLQGLKELKIGYIYLLEDAGQDQEPELLAAKGNIYNITESTDFFPSSVKKQKNHVGSAVEFMCQDSICSQAWLTVVTGCDSPIAQHAQMIAQDTYSPSHYDCTWHIFTQPLGHHLLDIPVRIWLLLKVMNNSNTWKLWNCIGTIHGGFLLTVTGGFCGKVCWLPTCVFFFFQVEICLSALIPLFTTGSCHSGSVSWDDCGWVFPDELRVNSISLIGSHTIKYHAWTA